MCIRDRESTAPLIESSTDQISDTFSAEKVASLPVGNSFDSLALFIPGVATAGDVSFSNNNGAEISVNGERARSNNFQIDGQSNNDNSVAGPSIEFGNQDAIAEIQVVTNYDAEFGRNTGAVVNYVTKSGTNQFHGTAYEIYDGSVSYTHLDVYKRQENGRHAAALRALQILEDHNGHLRALGWTQHLIHRLIRGCAPICSQDQSQ